MARDVELPALSEAQLEIMNVIWDREACAVADVWKVLAERRGVSRNTVHTLIARLEEKGWLARRETSGGLLYAATVSRADAQQRLVQKVVETVFGGSAEGLVLALLGSDALSKAEADRIRQIIAQAKRSKS
ncbi:MAG TPA: BlaI/MecI/CopY family transcriptional regulator [Pirellulales bacterium]|nr:BlaI/MecI/CopY family transcriptional regulator [Pirellulales bacterium]